LRRLGTQFDGGLAKRAGRQRLNPTFAVRGRDERACVERAEKKPAGEQFFDADQGMTVLRKQNSGEENTHQGHFRRVELAELFNQRLERLRLIDRAFDRAPIKPARFDSGQFWR